MCLRKDRLCFRRQLALIKRRFRIGVCGREVNELTLDVFALKSVASIAEIDYYVNHYKIFLSKNRGRMQVFFVNIAFTYLGFAENSW